ncbi:hypothetical protein [Nonomuraea sp. NPDC048826]|uniref:hypothetical protein n=1 Tax=Nonomuraea sp. NPDC048826 TaxID=3364347 RepID=UPI00371698D8
MRSKRTTALSAAVMTAAFTLTALPTVPAPAAHAATAPACVSPARPYNGEGGGRMNGNFNLKVAPYAHCGNVRRLTTGTRVYFGCAHYNAYGNRWWWVRVAGTSVYGWMNDDNIDWEDIDENGDGDIDWRMCTGA